MATKKTEYKSSVYCGIVNGKAIYKYIRASSQRELNHKRDMLKQEVRNGKDICTKAIFGIWANKWLDEVKKPHVCNGTYIQYESCIKQLNNAFEFVEFKKISLSDFQSFINELAIKNPNTDKPMSKKYLEDIKKTASAVFGYARSNGIASVPDFFKCVTIPKDAPKTTRDALTEDEIQMIVDTPHMAQLPSMIMLFGGLRRGETIPLQWKDIDLKRGLISITKSVELDGNNPIVKKGGKSVNATRIVPIPQILVDYLLNYKAENKVLSPLVCTNAHGSMHTKSSWRKMWESYMTELNLKYGYDGKYNKYDKTVKASELPMMIKEITPHYLRHTFATMLFLQGVEVGQAKQYLGHADISVTMNLYTDMEHFNKHTISDTYKNKLDNEYNVRGA